MQFNVSSNNKIPYKSGPHLFFSFFWKNPTMLTVALVLLVLTSLLTLLPAVIIGIALDILFDEGFGPAFIKLSLLLIVIAFLNYGASFTANYFFMITSFAYERDIRQEYFDVIQGHSLTFHNENNSSKLLSLGMTEIQLIRHAIMPSLRMIIQSFFTIVLLLVIAQQLIDISIVYTILGVFIFYFYFAYRYTKKIGPIRLKLSESVGNITEQSQEIFRGIEVVRSLSSNNREINKFNSTSGNFAKLSKTEGQMSAFYIPGLILLGLTAYIFGILVFDVASGNLTVGVLIQIVGMLLALQFMNFTLPMALLDIRAALTNSQRLWEKMSWQDPQSIQYEPMDTEINWGGDLEFKNVTFSYNEKYDNVLSDISLKIPKHSKVALIGGPGSGKTTLLKLLLDLYQQQQGEIKIDGIDYRHIPEKEIRKHVSMVEQEIFLFSGTIRNNIAFTRSTATEEEILNAAKAAQAFEFIKEMPQGLDTIIGERGVTLSGGQRQRLAIARAILADPEILLLDDTSSALDAKTETQIRKALDNLSKDRLTITVTQRLNTLVRADLIILLDKGKIVGLGNHNELIEYNNKYRTIFDLLPESERLLLDLKNLTEGAEL